MVQVAQAAAAALSLGVEVTGGERDHTRRYPSELGNLATTVRRPTGGEEGDRLLGKMERRAAVSLLLGHAQKVLDVMLYTCNTDLICADNAVTRSAVADVQHWQNTMRQRNSKRQRRLYAHAPYLHYCCDRYCAELTIPPKQHLILFEGATNGRLVFLSCLALRCRRPPTLYLKRASESKRLRYELRDACGD